MDVDSINFGPVGRRDGKRTLGESPLSFPNSFERHHHHPHPTPPWKSIFCFGFANLPERKKAAMSAESLAASSAPSPAALPLLEEAVVEPLMASDWGRWLLRIWSLYYRHDDQPPFQDPDSRMTGKTKSYFPPHRISLKPIQRDGGGGGGDGAKVAGVGEERCGWMDGWLDCPGSRANGYNNRKRTRRKVCARRLPF